MKILERKESVASVTRRSAPRTSMMKVGLEENDWKTESMLERTIPDTRQPSPIHPTSPLFWRARLSGFTAAVLCCLFWLLAPSSQAQSLHSDPLNLDPRVQDALGHFYNLDYDGALARFEAIQREHPQSPMAIGFVLTVAIFRELYHQDLLDTTYYAHD